MQELGRMIWTDLRTVRPAIAAWEKGASWRAQGGPANNVCAWTDLPPPQDLMQQQASFEAALFTI